MPLFKEIPKIEIQISRKWRLFSRYSFIVFLCFIFYLFNIYHHQYHVNKFKKFDSKTISGLIINNEPTKTGVELTISEYKNQYQINPKNVDENSRIKLYNHELIGDSVYKQTFNDTLYVFVKNTKSVLKYSFKILQ